MVQLWAVGEVLGPPQDLEWITVALSVDLPVAEVPWWTVPLGRGHLGGDDSTVEVPGR